MKRPRQRTDLRNAGDLRGFGGFAQPQGMPPAPAPGRPAAPARMPGDGTAAGRETSRGVPPHPDAGLAGHDLMGNLAAFVATGGGGDVISDGQARLNSDLGGVTDRTPENLPAVISKAVAETGGGMTAPRWHMVRNLPGYLQQAIRGLGRQVFGQFTDTPIEDIQTVTTLSNPEGEVRSMMSWIRRNGVRDDAAEMDFSASIRGYTAQVQVWNTQGYTFLLVNDRAGYYVYGWPGGRGVHLEHDAEEVPLLPRR